MALESPDKSKEQKRKHILQEKFATTHRKSSSEALARKVQDKLRSSSEQYFARKRSEKKTNLSKKIFLLPTR
jgi:hypothetical protein